MTREGVLQQLHLASADTSSKTPSVGIRRVRRITWSRRTHPQGQQTRHLPGSRFRTRTPVGAVLSRVGWRQYRAHAGRLAGSVSVQPPSGRCLGVVRRRRTPGFGRRTLDVPPVCPTRRRRTTRATERPAVIERGDTRPVSTLGGLLSSVRNRGLRGGIVTPEPSVEDFCSSATIRGRRATELGRFFPLAPAGVHMKAITRGAEVDGR